MDSVQARRAELKALLDDAKQRGDAYDVQLLEASLQALGPVAPDSGKDSTAPGVARTEPARESGLKRTLREAVGPSVGIAEEAVKQGLTTVPMLGELATLGAKKAGNWLFGRSEPEAPHPALGRDDNPFPVSSGIERGVEKAFDLVRPEGEYDATDRAIHRIGGSTVLGGATPRLLASLLRQQAQGAVRSALAGGGSAIGGEIGTRAATHALGGMPGGDAGENSGILPGAMAVAGSFLGGLPFSWRQLPPNARELVKESLRGQGIAEFSKARDNLRTLRQAGVENWTPDQLFDKPGALQQLMGDTLRNAPADADSFLSRARNWATGGSSLNSGGSAQGTDLYRRVLAQPEESVTRAQALGNQIGPAVPRSAAVRDMRQASENAISDAKSLPRNVKSLFGPDATQVPPDITNAIEARLGQLAATFRSDRDAAGLVQQLQADLERLVNRQTVQLGTRSQQVLTHPEGGAARHLMTTRQVPVSVEVNTGGQLGEFDTAINVFKDRARRLEASLDQSGISGATRAKALEAIGDVQRLLDDVVTTRPQGRELTKSHFQRVEDLTSGLLGRMAGRQGVDEALPDPTNLLSAWLPPRFDARQDIATASQTLRQHGRQLAARNPNMADPELTEQLRQARSAVPQTARQLYDAEVATAFNTGVDASRASPAGGRRLAEALLAGPKGRNWNTLLTEATRDAATAANLPHDAVTRGVEQVLRALEITSRGRNVAAAEHPMNLAKLVNESEARSMFRMAQPLSQTEEGSRLIREARTSKVYRDVAKILSDPEVLEKLAEIGSSRLVDRRTAAQLQTIVQSIQNPRRIEGEEKKRAP